MTVEVVTYINDLNATLPAAGDAKSEGDDHIRNIKTGIKNTFTNVSGAVTPTHTELNYVDGVTSPIQTQIDLKAPLAGPTFTGTTTVAALTASGTVTLPATTAIGTVSATEIGYVDGVTSSIQTQLDAKAPIASGSLTLLSTVTASASATVDVETTFSSTYDAYVIVVSGLVPATNATGLSIRMKLGGAYAATSYHYHVAKPLSDAATYNADAGFGATSIVVGSGSHGNAAGSSAAYVIHVYNPSSTSLRKHLTVQGVITLDGNNVFAVSGAGGNAATTALTGIRFLMSAGNITSGTFRLYGIKNS